MINILELHSPSKNIKASKGAKLSLDIRQLKHFYELHETKMTEFNPL